jgi:hypothetical protein
VVQRVSGKRRCRERDPSTGRSFLLYTPSRAHQGEQNTLAGHWGHGKHCFAMLNRVAPRRVPQLEARRMRRRKRIEQALTSPIRIHWVLILAVRRSWCLLYPCSRGMSFLRVVARGGTSRKKVSLIARYAMRSGAREPVDDGFEISGRRYRCPGSGCVHAEYARRP